MAITTPARAQFAVRRSYPANIEDVWRHWTTGSGIEAWWGPEGFEVQVISLDLRPGGTLAYAMTAISEDQVAFMSRTGKPLWTDCLVTYTGVTAPRRLAYCTLADFVPGVEPYEVATVVELDGSGGITDVTVTFEAMHDEVWTARARAGHESQLRKLDAVLNSMAGQDQA